MKGGAARYLPLLLIAILWEGASRVGLVAPDVLPPLSQVASAWFALLLDGEIVHGAAASLYRAAAGLGSAVAVGTVIGIMMASSRSALVFVGPLVEMFYPVPKSALIPVTAAWLGFGDGSKILLIFLGCMLPVTIGAFNGARGTDQELLWSARGMGASRREVLWDVVFPSALPELLNGIRTALALTFVLLVASELIVARQGLGYMIGNLGSNGVYDAMFAVVLTVAFLGFAADRSYLLLVRRVMMWRE